MEVRSTLADDVAEVQRISAGLPATKRAALVSIGYRLLANQRQHFGQLVQSGSSLGVTWPKAAASTIARRRALQRRGLLANAEPDEIGVLTGGLARSFRFRLKSDSVSLTNTDPQANYFASKRPIFPRTFPAAWLQDAETITQRKLDQLTRKE